MKLSWVQLFEEFDLYNLLNGVYNGDNTCPKKEKIFRCFEYFDVLETKVVICGQDPYHTEHVATGLSFDCGEFKPQPSLRNIFKEVTRTYPDSLCKIEEWAKQGVLMFNRAFTVEQNKPKSHIKYWNDTTNQMIHKLSGYWKSNNIRVVFMLWGKNAQELEPFIDTNFHIILKHSHPSPLARKPFVGNNHFLLCNNFLHEKIVW